jgi:hypothetical protein
LRPVVAHEGYAISKVISPLTRVSAFDDAHGVVSNV